MISRPQNDLRHTGHIGYDGAVFGDVAFIGGNYDKLPVKVVNTREYNCYKSVKKLLETRSLETDGNLLLIAREG